MLNVVNPPNTTAVILEGVSEYCFIHPNGDCLDVYDSKDGKIYSLTEAYEKGLLSEENIKSVNELYKKANPSLYADGKRPKRGSGCPLEDAYGVGVQLLYTVIGKFDYNPYYEINVAGYTFKLLGDESIVVSYNKTRYTLEEAYEAKIITDAHVKTIYDRWTER